MGNAPHWTQYVTAIIVPFIAVVASWIAFRQSQIARNKLKLDLFDRRMAVHQAVREALGCVTRSGRLTKEEELAYLIAVRPAKWLFGPEVDEYLNKTLWHKLVDLELHNSMMEGPPYDAERSKHIQARTETFTWIVAQYDAFDALCSKYLSLKH